MAEKHGKEGAFKLTTNTVAHCTEWSIDAAQAADEVTAFGDYWKSFIAGMAEWSGTATGSYDYSDTNGQKVLQDLIITASPTGTTANARFYLDGTYYLAGTIFITSFSITTPVNGVVTFTIAFQGSGALSYN